MKIAFTAKPEDTANTKVLRVLPASFATRSISAVVNSETEMFGSLITVSGLKREAALIVALGLICEVGGGDDLTLWTKLEHRLRQAPRAVISIGLGGALSPALEVGDWVIGERVVGANEIFDSHPGLVAELHEGLANLQSVASPPPAEPSEGDYGDRFGRIFTGAIAGSAVMVVDAAAKAALNVRTGALAVDMESHVAAAFAAAHRLPFAALRVISDDAARSLPKAAQAGMKKDGGMDIFAVLKELAKAPLQLPALIRTGREAEVAFGRLKLLGRDNLLGRLRIGDSDLGQLTLDVI